MVRPGDQETDATDKIVFAYRLQEEGHASPHRAIQGSIRINQEMGVVKGKAWAKAFIVVSTVKARQSKHA